MLGLWLQACRAKGHTMGMHTHTDPTWHHAHIPRFLMCWSTDQNFKRVACGEAPLLWDTASVLPLGPSTLKKFRIDYVHLLHRKNFLQQCPLNILGG